jgi:hypothetical protein
MQTEITSSQRWKDYQAQQQAKGTDYITFNNDLYKKDAK